MSLSLEDLKKQFQASEQKTNFSTGEWFPFWKADFDAVSIFRFLPDGDPKASHFLVEKWMHNLNVTIDGKEERRTVPCLQMYGKRCPMCEVAKKFYDEDDEVNGSRFYKKRSWIGQGIVVESAFDYDEPDKQPKLISVGWQIYSSIKTAIMQNDVEGNPTDLKNGYNFRIIKTRQGTKANYANSRFSPKSSAVEDKLLETIELYVLKDKLPKEPDLSNVEAMLTSALTGEAYTPPGKSSNSAFSAPDRSTKTTAPVVKDEEEDTSPPWEVEEKEETASVPAVKSPKPSEEESSGLSEADEILNAIRRRKANRE